MNILYKLRIKKNILYIHTFFRVIIPNPIIIFPCNLNKMKIIRIKCLIINVECCCS